MPNPTGVPRHLWMLGQGYREFPVSSALSVLTLFFRSGISGAMISGAMISGAMVASHRSGSDKRHRSTRHAFLRREIVERPFVLMKFVISKKCFPEKQCDGGFHPSAPLDEIYGFAVYQRTERSHHGLSSRHSRGPAGFILEKRGWHRRHGDSEPGVHILQKTCWKVAFQHYLKIVPDAFTFENRFQPRPAVGCGSRQK